MESAKRGWFPDFKGKARKKISQKSQKSRELNAVISQTKNFRRKKNRESCKIFIATINSCHILFH